MSNFKAVTFSEAMKHMDGKKRGIVQPNYWVHVNGEDCVGVLFDDGTAIVHSFGCSGPISKVTPDCDYWSTFYVLPPICHNHDQLPRKTVCQVCGRMKDKEWQQRA